MTDLKAIRVHSPTGPIMFFRGLFLLAHVSLASSFCLSTRRLQSFSVHQLTRALAVPALTTQSRRFGKELGADAEGVRPGEGADAEGVRPGEARTFGNPSPYELVVRDTEAAEPEKANNIAFYVSSARLAPDPEDTRTGLIFGRRYIKAVRLLGAVVCSPDASTYNIISKAVDQDVEFEYDRLRSAVNTGIASEAVAVIKAAIDATQKP